MSTINEKLGFKPAGKRSMMKLPADRAEATSLTSARCPSCNRTGAIENVIHGKRTRMCTWCNAFWEPEVCANSRRGEKERPEAFLRHATVATSQYDAQYRSMASEILALRADRAVCAALVTERNRLLDLFECPVHGNQCVPHAMEEVARLRAKVAQTYEDRR